MLQKKINQEPKKYIKYGELKLFSIVNEVEEQIDQKWRQEHPLEQIKEDNEKDKSFVEEDTVNGQNSQRSLNQVQQSQKNQAKAAPTDKDQPLPARPSLALNKIQATQISTIQPLSNSQRNISLGKIGKMDLFIFLALMGGILKKHVVNDLHIFLPLPYYYHL